MTWVLEAEGRAGPVGVRLPKVVACHDPFEGDRRSEHQFTFPGAHSRVAHVIPAQQRPTTSFPLRKYWPVPESVGENVVWPRL